MSANGLNHFPVFTGLPGLVRFGSHKPGLLRRPRPDEVDRASVAALRVCSKGVPRKPWCPILSASRLTVSPRFTGISPRTVKPNSLLHRRFGDHFTNFTGVTATHIVAPDYLPDRSYRCELNYRFSFLIDAAFCGIHISVGRKSQTSTRWGPNSLAHHRTFPRNTSKWILLLLHFSVHSARSRAPIFVRLWYSLPAMLRL